MRDPYTVLGVSRDATNEEIKKAYRALCRKYHPDANINNPNKAQAEEMFKEVGEAYSRIMDERNGKTNTSSYSQSSFSGEEAVDSRLRAAAAYIQRGYFREAINVLNSVTEHNAMWYYLSAIANARLGNNIMAAEYARMAAAMEPNNPAYQNLSAGLNGGGQFYRDYRTAGQTYGRTYSFDDSNYCIKCCAANICLNICCGSRILCC